ncbi:hypothetical protein KFR76_05825 [Corynebacterium diphtheriae]|nr:hypothetical protein KFR76_05825 [Corynebacterium diphtheriae]
MKSRALTALLATSLILGAAPAAHAQQAKEPLPLPQVFVDNNKGDTTNLDQTELLKSVNGRRIAAKDLREFALLLTQENKGLKAAQAAAAECLPLLKIVFAFIGS